MNSLPPILYHYTSITAFKNILRKKQFWLTHYKDVEDNNELELGVKILEQILAKKFTGEDLLNEQLRNISRTIPEESYIGCFCHRNDNEYLVNKYAYNGVIIGFDTNFWLKQNSVKLAPVIYDLNSYKKMCLTIVDKIRSPNLSHETLKNLTEIALIKDRERFIRELRKIPNYIETRDSICELAAWGTLLKNPSPYLAEEELRLIHNPEFEEELTYLDAHKRRRAVFDFGNLPLPIVTVNFVDSYECVKRKGVPNFMKKYKFDLEEAQS